MTDSNPNTSPRARRDGLVIRSLPEEVLIYDLHRHKAHCLNGSAAIIWNHCDGKTTIEQMAGLLEEALENPVDEEMVRYGLDQLEKAHLLVAGAERPRRERMTRREAARKIGLAALVGLPLVTSILTPTVAQAASCRAGGQPCGTSVQCCSGLCSGSVCAG
ncbi:MAG TPA: PqqD family protein [Blastocatellia bacterium]|jgi:hypothetical protein|nr:PqqD family protein [Blastocatellia bacterium]